MAKNLYTLIILFFMHDLHAASCCGGGSSASSLIIGDHLQEWTLADQYRSDIGQTNNDGGAMMDADDNSDHTNTLSLEFKRMFTPKAQGNLSLTYIFKDSERLGKNESSSGLGDIGLGGFYEVLTNYNYNELNARLFAGIKFIIPFGENNFNSNKELRTDIRGSGFYKIDVPIVLVKNEWKFSATPQYLPSQKNLSHTYAFTTAGSYSYSFNDKFDLTSTVQWSYQAHKTYLKQNLVSSQYWDLSLSPAWFFTPGKSLNLTYSDSSLLGKSRNSAIYRAISLGMTWAVLL
jgi:hypothetical protein